MGGIVGITGTPGTGKKTVAPLVADMLHLPSVHLNGLARRYGLIAEEAGDGSVDTEELRDRFTREAKSSVVFGHLVPYALDARLARRVAILRCEPSVLKGRLEERGYDSRKVTENVEAELIGVVSADAYDRFGPAKTFEVDATVAKPRVIAELIAGIIAGSAEPPPRLDWTTGYDSGAKLRSLLSER